MNSFSSVLSYNQFDFEPIFKKNTKDYQRVRHEPTMVKQAIYFLIMTTLNIG